MSERQTVSARYYTDYILPAAKSMTTPICATMKTMVLVLATAVSVTFEGADTVEICGDCCVNDQHNYFKVMSHNMKG